ncbi:MAG: phosphotransferase family protein [Planctomycetota bacterium]
MNPFLEQLRADGVVTSSDATLSPLAGGVSSDIYRVDDGGRVFVVKRALGQLRVADTWTASLSRNRFEQRYLRYVGGFLPQAVPCLLKGDEERGYFAMEHLGEGFENWKTRLLQGRFDRDVASRAAAILGEIHRRSSDDPAARRLFDSTGNFRELRIEPYLVTTAGRHPPIEAPMLAEAERLAETRECLVHGDYSPKNILVGPERCVILDCEVAWYGDGAFDLAFLLNHLFLKAAYHAPQGAGLEPLVDATLESYFAARGEVLPRRAELMERVGRLLPMLMLARVDGKSPAEYLDASRRNAVRELAAEWIASGCHDFSALRRAWFARFASTPFPGL